VLPLAIITSSVSVGTTPPTHVVVAKKSPPVDVLVIVAANIPQANNSITTVKKFDLGNSVFIKKFIIFRAIYRIKKRYFIAQINKIKNKNKNISDK
jgi:hypothetical protein